MNISLIQSVKLSKIVINYYCITAVDQWQTPQDFAFCVITQIITNNYLYFKDLSPHAIIKELDSLYINQ